MVFLMSQFSVFIFSTWLKFKHCAFDFYFNTLSHSSALECLLFTQPHLTFYMMRHLYLSVNVSSCNMILCVWLGIGPSNIAVNMLAIVIANLECRAKNEIHVFLIRTRHPPHMLEFVYLVTTKLILYGIILQNKFNSVLKK